MPNTPKLASVATLYTHTVRDVPAVLRAIADQIEEGAYGDARQAAVVLLGDQLDVFGAGDCDSTDVHYLLSCGVSIMQEPCLRKGRD